MSAWVCVDEDGEELITAQKPIKTSYVWVSDKDIIYLPKGSIEKLIGRTLTWDENPVELKDHKPYSLDNPNDVE
jgi:hypothetical protein